MSKKKVLVIDDEDFIRELVKDFLEIEDVQCDGAESAEDALTLMARNDYHLILLDRNLGKNRAEDIIEILHQVKREIPVVILTGDAECSDDYIEEIGATGIIFKPFQVNEFMEKINKFLEI